MFTLDPPLETFVRIKTLSLETSYSETLSFVTRKADGFLSFSVFMCLFYLKRNSDPMLGIAGSISLILVSPRDC